MLSWKDKKKHTKYFPQNKKTASMSYPDTPVSICVRHFSLSIQMSLILASKEVELRRLISVTDALPCEPKYHPTQNNNNPEMLICSYKVVWQLGQELAVLHSDLLPVQFCSCVHENSDLLLPNIHRRCQNCPAGPMIAWAELDGSPRVKFR